MPWDPLQGAAAFSSFLITELAWVGSPPGHVDAKSHPPPSSLGCALVFCSRRFSQECEYLQNTPYHRGSSGLFRVLVTCPPRRETRFPLMSAAELGLIRWDEAASRKMPDIQLLRGHFLPSFYRPSTGKNQTASRSPRSSTPRTWFMPRTATCTAMRWVFSRHSSQAQHPGL